MSAAPRPARLVGGLAIAVVLLALVGFATGLLGGGSGDSVRPACDTLGTHDQAQAALDARPDLVALLKDAGAAGVTVTDPCGDEDRSIITVRYANDQARESIDDVLATDDGFGVAVEVVRD